MAHLVLHDVDPEVIEALRERARQGGMPLEEQAKQLLAEAVGQSRSRALETARRIRAGLGGRIFADSAAILREERGR
jgi:plasmid stability protein